MGRSSPKEVLSFPPSQHTVKPVPLFSLSLNCFKTQQLRSHTTTPSSATAIGAPSSHSNSQLYSFNLSPHFDFEVKGLNNNVVFFFRLGHTH